MDRGQAKLADLFARVDQASEVASTLQRDATLKIAESLVLHREVNGAGTAAVGVGRSRRRGRAGRRLSKRFTRSQTAPRFARLALVEWLDGALSNEDTHGAKLAVSELVANAVTHGTGEVTMQADLNRDRLRVEVIDQGTGFAYRIPQARLEQLLRRGLAIVDAITSRWGIREGTTCVWFELDR